jgi:hypothetical protein
MEQARRSLIRDPVARGVALALLATPFAALAIHSASATDRGFDPHPPVSLDIALRLAIAAVLAAGVIASLIGERVARRRPVAGVVVATLVAWAVAIGAIPIASSLLGLPYEGAWVCIDACEAQLRGSDPASGFAALAESHLLDLVGPLEVAAPLAVAAWALSRSGRRRAAAATGIAAVVALNAWSMWFALPAAAALAFGAFLWVHPFLIRDGVPSTTPRPSAGSEAVSGP